MEHHCDTVGDREQLIEIFGDQNDGRAAAACGQELRVDIRDRAYIEAPGRLVGDDGDGLSDQRASQDQLLDIAARHGSRGRIQSRTTHVELVDDALGLFFGRRTLTPSVAGVLRVAVVLRDRVFPDREIANDTHRAAVLRHARHAGADERARRWRERPAIQANLAARRHQQSAQGIRQLRLAVAGDSRDAEDLASANIEGRVLELAARRESGD